MSAIVDGAGSVVLVHECGPGVGGAERYLEVLAAGLRRRGVDVGVVLTRDRSTVTHAFAEQISGACDWLVTSPRYWETGLARRLRRGRLVHWNLREPFAFRGGALLLLERRRPAIATDHLPMMRNRPHWEAMRRIANRRIDAMIVVGTYSRDAARAHWRVPPALHVVRNGVRIDTAAPRSVHRVPGPLRLLLLGRLEPQKNPGAAVDLLAALQHAGVDATLRVVGDGSLRDALAQRARAAGVEGLVEFTGYSEEPTRSLLDADVLVTPALFESGAPLASLEALAAGVPVVASDIAPHRELPGPGVRLVASAQPDAWAAAVASLTADPPPAEAIRAAVSPLSIDAMVDGTRAVYAAVLGRS